MKNVNTHLAAPEICSGVKVFMLARKIQGELDGGASLEQIIAAEVPTLNPQELGADVETLRDGITAIHNIKAEKVDSDWVSQVLNRALAGKPADRRADYLVNLIEGAAEAYPAVSLDAEEAEVLAAAKAGEEKTDGQVSELLAIVDRLLPQIGALMQRSYFRGMGRLVDKLDTEKVTAQVEFGQNYESAYAAAYYILQKKGELGKADDCLTPYMLGTIAAANVENSRLMLAFSAGKMTAEYLGERLCALYTAAVTYISENAIHAAAFLMHKTLAATLTLWFTSVLIGFGAAAYFSPLVLFVGAYIVASELFTEDEVESAIQVIWNIVKGVWNFIQNALPIRPRDNNPDEVPEAEDEDNETEHESVQARAAMDF